MANADKNNTPRNQYVTMERDAISVPVLWKWAAQGKVFEAGLSPEDSAVASSTSFADTTPRFSLQAPASTSLLVIPILLKVFLVTDGGGITNVQVAFTKPAGLCATTMTLTGTALTSKHALYRTNPAQTAQQAAALSACTLSAMVAADYVGYHFGHAIDATLTTGLVTPGTGPSNVDTFNFLGEGAPHIMTSGAAMVVYCYTGTSAGSHRAYMQWAEVTEDDLK